MEVVDLRGQSSGRFDQLRRGRAKDLELDPLGCLALSVHGAFRVRPLENSDQLIGGDGRLLSGHAWIGGNINVLEADLRRIMEHVQHLGEAAVGQGYLLRWLQICDVHDSLLLQSAADRSFPIDGRGGTDRVDSAAIASQHYQTFCRNDLVVVPVAPDEVRVIGYELKLETAEDVADLIPELIAADTWRTDEHPDRTGWIRIISKGYRPEFDGFGFGGGGFYQLGGESTGSAPGGSVFPAEKYAVLVIRQTREVHQKIENWLEALHATVLPDYQSTVPSVDLSVD